MDLPAQFEMQARVSVDYLKHEALVHSLTTHDEEELVLVGQMFRGFYTRGFRRKETGSYATARVLFDARGTKGRIRLRVRRSLTDASPGR